MDVLVAYASDHGSTRGIAERIADRLRARGIATTTAAAVEVEDPGRFGAVIAGSAIHSGRWLAQASAFLRAQHRVLAARPVWLFSVSCVGDAESVFPRPVAGVLRRARGETDEMRDLRRMVRARGHRNFAGVVEPGHWPRAGRLFLKLLGGRYGDHRNWRAIDAWADEVAHALASGATQAA